jgi:hypothetical protein
VCVIIKEAEIDEATQLLSQYSDLLRAGWFKDHIPVGL